MSAAIDAFLDGARQAANLLQEPNLLDLIGVVEEQARARALSILVVGSTGAGRCSTANVLLGQPGLLPVSPVPKPPISLTVAYGEPPSASATRLDGALIPVPVDGLRAFVLGAGDEADRYGLLRVMTPSPLLAHTQLRIESLGAQRSDDQWRELLATADYAIMVLNATALLSQRERRFLSEQLHPHFGLERVALVINQMDLVPEEERTDIVERVRAFLGPLEAQPAMVEFSAARSRAGLVSGEMEPDTGFEPLAELVAHDLIGQADSLRSASVIEGARLILSALEETASRQQAMLSVNHAGLQKRTTQLDAETEWFQSRIARAQARMRLFVETLAKERMMREIEGFGLTLRDQLPAEILAVEDITQIRRYLPGYIEGLWSRFFERQLTSVRGWLAKELQQVEEMIEEDIEGVLGEEASSLREAPADLGVGRAAGHPLLMPRRGRQGAPIAASALQVAGLVVWLTGGGVLGIAALGLGQLIRMATRKSVAESRKQAIVTSALEALPGLEGQIKAQVERHFTTLAGELEGKIRDLYAARIAETRALLEESLRQALALQARGEDLESLVRATLPDLKGQLAQLAEEIEG
jgi:hypothetical protein